MQVISLKRFPIIVQVFGLIFLLISFNLLAAESKIHLVREGETLYSIAKKYGISVSLITYIVGDPASLFNCIFTTQLSESS